MDVIIEKQNLHKENLRKQKRKLLFNFVTICFIWLFVFTAYSGLQNLEAAVNAETGLYSLAALTSGGVISCFIAPTVISYIGSKGALIVACICQCIFVASNYYPKPYILITGGAIVGLSSGLLWTAQSCYVTMIALDYHKITGESLEAILSRLFGIFFMACQSTQVWGNLISSAVFQLGGASTEQTNNTFCGAQYCPSEQTISNGNETSEAVIKPDHHLEITLISIYLGTTFIGLLLTVFVLKPIKSSMSDKYFTLKERLAANLKVLCTDLNMAMIIPFALYTGMEQVLMFAQFTTSFVACKLGIEWIGYTMICFGVCDTVGSLLVGIIAKYTGRLVLFFFGAFLNLGVLAFLRVWSLSGQVPFELFFVIPAVWGLADAVWQAQSDALLGSVFHQNPEIAFSSYLMFQAMGLAIAYIYNIYLCEEMKLYILGVTVIISLIFLCIIEFRVRRRKREEK
ncbi:unnamed protein product [Mytilus coruscus]|uniref:Uncharacterized protein n=1 Tax=Mytilus coruscus TaxID=42192 RepID=A0A6J8D9N1_MYTCO|nr:unnamed protein product [Mytilus coruscus]